MKKEKHENHCYCKKPHFERNKYYYGKLMTAEDYTREQCYFNEKRWLINKMTIGSGVVCGLDVVQIEGDEEHVKVMPGMAIDQWGREITVCEPQVVELKPENPPCRNMQQQKDLEQVDELDKKIYDICIEYWECETGQANIRPPICNQERKQEHNRIRDSFAIHLFHPREDSDTSPPKPFCPLDQKIDIDQLKQEEIEEEGEEEQQNQQQTYQKAQNEKQTTIQGQDDKQEELKVKSFHRYLCDRLRKEGCQGYPHCPCVHLATVTVTKGQEGEIEKIVIDPCKNRKLVYTNPMLYEMIYCFHGDLPHICRINWTHGEVMKWESVETFICETGLSVYFDKKMDEGTINKDTFLFFVLNEDSDNGTYIYEQVPGEIKVQYHGDYKITIATFNSTSKWLHDVFFGYSRVQDKGAKFLVILKSDFILSSEDNKSVKSLDGNFNGRKFPTGNGVQGGDFASWFYIEPKPQTSDDNIQQKK